MMISFELSMPGNNAWNGRDRGESMNDNKGAAARSSDDLEHDMLSHNVPKSEREWWAMHEIERLRNELAAVKIKHQERIHELETALRFNHRATEVMVTILNDYRAAPDFDLRLDAWMKAFAFLPDETKTTLAGKDS